METCHSTRMLQSSGSRIPTSGQHNHISWIFLDLSQFLNFFFSTLPLNWDPKQRQWLLCSSLLSLMIDESIVLKTHIHREKFGLITTQMLPWSQIWLSCECWSWSIEGDLMPVSTEKQNQNIKGWLGGMHACPENSVTGCGSANIW